MSHFVSKNGQRYGPYALAELREEVLANVFRPEDFVSIDEGQTWAQIRVLPGIGPLDFVIEAEAGQNLLIIRYHGHVRSAAVERCAGEADKALTKLRPGFRLLADFSNLESMEVACAPHLKQIMRLCNRHEVSTIVRVIPHPQRDIGLHIMSYFHYGPEVQIKTCDTVEEARKILDCDQGQFAHAATGSLAEANE